MNGTFYILHLGQYLTQPMSGVYQKTISLRDSLQDFVQVKVVGFGKGDVPEDSEIIWNNCDKENVWTALELWCTENVAREDRIYLRYPFASKQLLNWMTKWGAQVFLEHNTIEENEAIEIQRRAWKASRMQFSRSFLKYSIDTWLLKKTNETVFGPDVLSKARGGVCVTHEIARYESNRSKGYQTFVFPNAISTVVSNAPLPVWNGRDIKVVMIIGSLSNWHGLERIGKSLDEVFSSDLNVQIDFIGIDEIDWLKKYHGRPGKEVNFLGRKTLSEINKLMEQYHIAIGSLGLHRIGITEACPLKVREYFGNGLPVLLSYDDTACLSNPQMEKWTLKVSADERSFSWLKVRDFLNVLYLNHNWKNELLEDAKRYLTYDQHASDFVQFIFKK